MRCRWRFASAQDSAKHYKENGTAHVIQYLECIVRFLSAEEIIRHELEETGSNLAVDNRTAEGMKPEETTCVTTIHRADFADDANELAMTSTLVFQCYYCVAAFGRRHTIVASKH